MDMEDLDPILRHPIEDPERITEKGHDANPRASADPTGALGPHGDAGDHVPYSPLQGRNDSWKMQSRIGE
jgi:hypothetical protein